MCQCAEGDIVYVVTNNFIIFILLLYRRIRGRKFNQIVTQDSALVGCDDGSLADRVLSARNERGRARRSHTLQHYQQLLLYWSGEFTIPYHVNMTCSWDVQMVKRCSTSDEPEQQQH